MKKVLFLCIIFIIFASTALYAQYSLDSYQGDSSNMRMKMGFIGSMGLSNVVLSDEHVGKCDPGLSASFGFFSRIKMNEYIAIQPEFVVNMDNYSYKFGDYYDTKTMVLSGQIPLSVLVSPSFQAERISGYAGGGVFVGVPFLANEDISNDYYRSAEDILEYISPFKYGVQAMAGATYDNIFAEIRGSYELNELYEDSNEGYEMHNWNIRLTLGFMIN
ncbi:MAG: outer membrane beta-barrel protein [Candidatus Cloacimonetes bacterium]|nr:outer membrane beta-barrel protein [Candidatus Cloacimonadota bacterium]